jgi:hypothetical protein
MVTASRLRVKAESWVTFGAKLAELKTKTGRNRNRIDELTIPREIFRPLQVEVLHERITDPEVASAAI